MKKCVTLQDLRDSKELRKKVLGAYCEHVSSGFKGDSFEIDKKIIEKCFQEFRDEFEHEHGLSIEAAEREGLRFWESVGRSQALGECLGNARAWIYNMANRYGWTDKQRVEQEHKGTVAVNIVQYKAPGGAVDTQGS